MCISNDGPEVFSSYASRKSRSDITIWMPWPLNRDLGGRGKWPSNHFRLYTAHCICTEAQEIQAPCMFDCQGTQTFFSRWNAKSQIRSLVCTLRNSNIAITSVVCTLCNSKCAISNDNSNYALCSRVKTVIEYILACHILISERGIELQEKRKNKFHVHMESCPQLVAILTIFK